MNDSQKQIRLTDAPIIYDGTSVKQFPVLTDGETVWLSIEQMAKLFGRDVSVIGKHVNHVFRDGELEILPNRQNLPIWGKIHPVAYYSLDVVISVGYRVKSIEGVRFRQWATQKLREILLAKLQLANRVDKMELHLENLDMRFSVLENGVAQLAENFNRPEEPFYPDDRQMIGFGAEQKA